MGSADSVGNVMKFLKGFVYAGRGIWAALKQRNFRFHLCAAAFVIFFAARFYSFSAERWAVLLLTCGLVLSLEVINTAVEKLADSVTLEENPLIKAAKDCAAGAVLIAAVIAVAVGVFLFWDKGIFSLIALYFSEPVRLSALLMAVAAAWGAVFIPKSK